MEFVQGDTVLYADLDLLGDEERDALARSAPRRQGGRASSQSNFVRANIQKACHRVSHTAVRLGPTGPRKSCVLLIDEFGEPLVFSEHRISHDSPIAVFKIGYFVGDVIIFRDRLPRSLVVRSQWTRRQPIANRSIKARGILFPISCVCGQRAANRYRPRRRNPASQKLSRVTCCFLMGQSEAVSLCPRVSASARAPRQKKRRHSTKSSIIGP
jgi:hypothetical protein